MLSRVLKSKNRGFPKKLAVFGVADACQWVFFRILIKNPQMRKIYHPYRIQPSAAAATSAGPKLTFSAMALRCSFAR